MYRQTNQPTNQIHPYYYVDSGELMPFKRNMQPHLSKTSHNIFRCLTVSPVVGEEVGDGNAINPLLTHANEQTRSPLPSLLLASYLAQFVTGFVAEPKLMVFKLAIS